MVEQKRLIEALQSYLEQRASEVPPPGYGSGNFIQITGIEHLRSLQPSDKCNVLTNMVKEMMDASKVVTKNN